MDDQEKKEQQMQGLELTPEQKRDLVADALNPAVPASAFNEKIQKLSALQQLRQ